MVLVPTIGSSSPAFSCFADGSVSAVAWLEGPEKEGLGMCSDPGTWISGPLAEESLRGDAGRLTAGES